MLDIALLRDHPDDVRRLLERREIAGVDLDDLIALDGERRRVRAEAEQLRSEQKTLGSQVPEVIDLEDYGYADRRLPLSLTTEEVDAARAEYPHYERFEVAARDARLMVAADDLDAICFVLWRRFAPEQKQDQGQTENRR